MFRYLTQLSVLALSLTLIACGGGDDDSSQGDTNTNNQISINIFDSKYDLSAQKEGIARIKWIYADGSRTLSKTDIVHQNNRQGLNNSDLVVIGSKFESILAKQAIDVSGNTITYPMKNIANGTTEKYQIELQEISLAGVSSKNGNLNKETGIITDLNYFDKIPDTVSFPEGSVCYVPKESSTIAFFSFDPKTDFTSYQNLTDWVANYSDMYGQEKPVIRAEQSKVGIYNEYPAVRVVYDTDPVNENLNYSAVNYQNVIFSTEYTPKGSFSENTDLAKGAINCTVINDVAADFLQKQILQYY